MLILSDYPVAHNKISVLRDKRRPVKRDWAVLSKDTPVDISI